MRSTMLAEKMICKPTCSIRRDSVLFHHLSTLRTIFSYSDIFKILFFIEFKYFFPTSIRSQMILINCVILVWNITPINKPTQKAKMCFTNWTFNMITSTNFLYFLVAASIWTNTKIFKLKNTFSFIILTALIWMINSSSIT